MSTEGLPALLPKLSPDTRIFYRDESEKYLANAYQYATTSHNRNAMKPAAIIYPTNLDDIIAVVKHAKEQGIGIAVRTGGHQYSGACSTSGDNIQLDMSDVFESDDDYVYDSSKNLLHVGVSFSLLQMNTRLRERGLFLPHGQCVHVHLGGHVQTGGYGSLTRAFGLLADHAEGFDIVLASGDHVTIWKPDSEMADRNRTPEQRQFDNDLYWAVLGGSPGNFGILTHVWLRPLHDEDYPDSRGMRFYTVYSREKLENILNVYAEMNDDKDLARDFDSTLTLLSDSMQGFALRQIFNSKGSNYKNFDEEMLFKHPHEYADGVEYAEKGKMAIPDIPLPLIGIFLQWANVKGAEETFGEKQRYWFERMRNVTSPNIVDATVESITEGLFASAFKALKDLLLNKDVLNWLHVDEDKHTPMSQLTRYWCWEDIREYVKPYEKRTYLCNKDNLSTSGWAAWLSRRVNMILTDKDGDDTSLCLQVLLKGGNNSMLNVNGRKGLNSHSWRSEISSSVNLDVFYQPENEDDQKDERLKRILQWQAENDTCSQKGGIFTSQDRRFLWSSYARHGDPDGGANLHSVREKYFDSEEKYQKLVQIKRRVDPEYIFTANMFGVDANNAPENRKLLICGRGYGVHDDASPKRDSMPIKDSTHTDPATQPATQPRTDTPSTDGDTGCFSRFSGCVIL